MACLKVRTCCSMVSTCCPGEGFADRTDFAFLAAFSVTDIFSAGAAFLPYSYSAHSRCIMAVMARREADTPLSGRVEMDDAYLGGARAGGKRGRGAPGKTPFVAAVSTSPEGRPRKVKLVPVKGFRKREIARGANGPRKRGPHRRPALLERARRGRRKPSRDPHRLRAAGRPHGALQMGP